MMNVNYEAKIARQTCFLINLIKINMVTKRLIDQEHIDKQQTLLPFTFDSLPIVDEWVELEEFPCYEINRNGIVRDKNTKMISTNYNGFVHLYDENHKIKNRSIAMLQRTTFGFDEIEGEYWCEVAEFQDIIVSDLGRVYNRNTKRLLKGTDDKGYLDVKINDKKYKIHVLVALAFLGPPPSPKHTVNHINRTKSDNRLENLEYMTMSEQLIHAHATGFKIKNRPVINLPTINLSDEVWETDKITNTYKVSNYGRISSNKTILKITYDLKGYGRIGMCNKTYLVHVVVATTFIPNPDNKEVVDHINFRPSDNRVQNLQWLSHKENTERSIAKAVCRYDPLTKETSEYKSVITAAEEVFPNDITNAKAAISRAARGEDNRLQYKGFYWWFPNENSNRLEEILNKLAARREACDKTKYICEIEEQDRLLPFCSLHKHCNFDHEFELSSNPLYEYINSDDNKELKWIRISGFPGYKISSDKTVQHFDNDKPVNKTKCGRVKLHDGNTKHSLSLDLLHRKHFGFTDNEIINGEKCMHIEIAKQYIVSNLGRIMNCETLEFLACAPQVKKYEVRLNDNTKKTLGYLVATAFIPKKDHDKYVHYLDGNMRNCEINNLKWNHKVQKQKISDITECMESLAL